MTLILKSDINTDLLDKTVTTLMNNNLHTNFKLDIVNQDTQINSLVQMGISEDTRIIRNFIYDNLFKEEDNKKLRMRHIHRDNIIVVEDIAQNTLMYIWSYSAKCSKIYISTISKLKNVITIGNVMLNDIKSWFNQIRMTTQRTNIPEFDPFKFESLMD